MIKVLFITNLPAPYKIDFLNNLGKKVNLTVIFERSSALNRNKRWFDDSQQFKHFEAIQLAGFSIGNENSADLGIVNHLRKNRYDVVLINGYSSYSEIAAICYLKKHKRRFAIICDGIILKNEMCFKRNIKRHLISSADYWLSPNTITDLSLKKNGAVSERIYRYPFSSISEAELAEVPYNRNYYKSIIGCNSKYMILYVGQMIHRKGVDVLIDSVKQLNMDYQLYLVGDKTSLGLQNDRIKNIDFLSKQELKNYYMAADVSILPSREDIWGLVINEALSLGTPVIASDQCGAALEMIQEKENGLIVPACRTDLLKKAIETVLQDREPEHYMRQATETAKQYTIEAMSSAVYKAVQMNEN